MSRQFQHASSFRDPAGFIFIHNDKLYRQINQAGRDDFDHFIESGLYDTLIQKGLLVTHREVTKNLPPGDDSDLRYKVIAPTRVPFISYPYEWSFSQLKDAALLTLRVQKLAFKHGMILKDASAYNIQFIGKKPILIDTLSFKKYVPGEPWEGYRQFCEHFLAPLAVARYTSYDVLKMLEVQLEGLSLELACALLPRRARLGKGLFSHLYLHNASQKKYQNAASESAGAVPKRKVSAFALEGIVASLERSIRALRAPRQKTEWGNYYTFTNYSDQAFKRKQKLVASLLQQVRPKPRMVWDVGANNGEFSVLAAHMGVYTVACDIDPVAVERNYRARDEASDCLMLPLVQDCTNPSSAVGWMHRERDSLFARGPADVVMALAIIHHLAIGRNLPLGHIAEFLASIGKHVIIEFVPKEDSKVQILLASRKDIFSEYDIEHFEAAMGQYFKLVEKQPIKQTKRTLYLYKKR